MDAHRLFGHGHLSIRNVRAGNAQAGLLLPLDFTRIGLKFDGLLAPQELALEIRYQLHGVMSGLRHRRRGRKSAKNTEQRNLLHRLTRGMRESISRRGHAEPAIELTLEKTLGQVDTHEGVGM